MANILGFVGLGVLGASILFALLALALPYWQTYDIVIASTKVSVNGGLFRVCVDSSCSDILDSSVDDKDSVRACQAMVLIGFFALIGSLVTLVLLLFVMTERKILGYPAGGLAIAGGLFLMIGMAIFVEKLSSSEADYGAGFAFVIMGWLAAWIAGGIILFMTFSTGKSDS